jgi:hypothetical protein
MACWWQITKKPYGINRGASLFAELNLFYELFAKTASLSNESSKILLFPFFLLSFLFFFHFILSPYITDARISASFRRRRCRSLFLFPARHPLPRASLCRGRGSCASPAARVALPSNHAAASLLRGRAPAASPLPSQLPARTAFASHRRPRVREGYFREGLASSFAAPAALLPRGGGNLVPERRQRPRARM